MRLLFRTAFVSIISFGLVFYAQPSFSCRIPDDAPREALEKLTTADVVFVGRGIDSATTKENKTNHYLITYEISKFWKGSPPKIEQTEENSAENSKQPAAPQPWHIKVKDDNSDCGQSTMKQLGRWLLIYAKQNTDNTFSLLDFGAMPVRHHDDFPHHVQQAHRELDALGEPKGILPISGN